MTGIFNKSKFLTTTRKILSENKDEKFALVSFDIDKFSLINAYLGIAEGDRLLKYIAEKLSLLVSGVPNSTFARIEADEFAFCIPYSNRENINSLVEKEVNRETSAEELYEMRSVFGKGTKVKNVISGKEEIEL